MTVRSHASDQSSMLAYERVAEIARGALSEPRAEFANVMLSRRTGLDLAPIIARYTTGDLDELIVLAPSRTDASWFQDTIGKHVTAWVPLRERVVFPNLPGGAPSGSGLCYFGPNPDRFAKAVRSIADVGPTGGYYRPIK